MKEDSYRMSNPADSDSDLLPSQRNATKGCFVTPAKGVIFCLLSAVVAIGVGVAVHFALPCPECHVNPPTSQPPEATTQPPTDEPPKEPAINFRLPSALIPYHYDLVVIPNFYEPLTSAEFSFTGQVTIYLRCVNKTDHFVLNYRQLIIYNDTLRVRNASDVIAYDQIELDPAKEFYRVHLRRNVTMLEDLTVTVNFSGPIRHDDIGLYWSSYVESGNITKFLVATQFAATEARKVFPCLDEPQLKATFNLSLWIKEPMIALSNMPNISTEESDSGWKTVHFEKTSVPMSTYLLAFVIADYRFVPSQDMDDKEIRSWSRPEAVASGQLDYFAERVPTIFKSLQDYFNHTYSLPKQDLLSMPDFKFHAMENWGLITFKDSVLLYDSHYVTTQAIHSMTTIVSHELVHMWLGNTVTCKWWNDMWIQEGGATYFKYHGLRNLPNSNWESEWQWFWFDDYRNGLRMDSGAQSIPLDILIIGPREAERSYHRLSYLKGASIFRMMNFVLSESLFDIAMRNYVKTMEYSSATHMDLFRAFDEVSRMDNVSIPFNVTLTDIGLTWIKQMGHPIVTFERTREVVRVNQSLFREDPGKPLNEMYPSVYNYSWYVPVQYTIGKVSHDVMTTELIWLLRDGGTITDNVEDGDDWWILGNAGVHGFYRVNYETRIWKALIKQLHQNHSAFVVLNRAQLIEDSMTLARVGLIPQVLGLELLEYLTNDTEWLPWQAAADVLPFVDLMLSKDPSYTKFREFVRILMTKNYELVNWIYTADDLTVDLYKKSTFIDLACAYDNEDCIEEANNLFSQWQQRPSNLSIIHPDIRQRVLCTSVANSGDSAWNFVFERYEMEWRKFYESPDTSRLRLALSCSNHHWILNKYFSMAINGDTRIHPNDRGSVMAEVASSLIGSTMAWDYIDAEWENETNRYLILQTVAKRFSTEYDLDKLENFYTRHPADSTQTENVYNEVRESVMKNVRWTRENIQDIRDWIATSVFTLTK